MPNPPDYYNDHEDPAKTALRAILIKEGNKILKETSRTNVNPDKQFIRDTLTYFKLECMESAK